MRPKGRWGTLLGAFTYLAGREATLLISGIAFSFMVSVFPFIVLLLTLSRYLRWNELRETIFDVFHTFFPVSQDFIIRNLRIYTQNPGGFHLFSFLLLAWGVSAFFFSLEAGLDSAYRVPSYRKFIRSQVLGTLMAIGFGVGVFSCIALFRAVQVGSRRWVDPRALEGVPIDRISAVAMAVAVTMLTFLAIFRYLPNRRQGFRRVWPEAVAAGAVWVLGNIGFRSLVPLWPLKDIYGPFFISITLLFWAYGTAAVILFFARLAADGFFRGANSEVGGLQSAMGSSKSEERSTWEGTLGAEPTLGKNDEEDHQQGGQGGED